MRLKEYFESNCIGNFNAVSKQELCTVFKTGERQIRLMIAELRQSGFPIVSTSDRKGYFLLNPENIHDRKIAEHFIAEMKHRAGEIIKAIRPVVSVLHGKDEQLNLFDEVV